jgi:hypothetical protein
MWFIVFETLSLEMKMDLMFEMVVCFVVLNVWWNAYDLQDLFNGNPSAQSSVCWFLVFGMHGILQMVLLSCGNGAHGGWIVTRIN